METTHFQGHYDSWNISRMNGIKKYISPKFFAGKSLLELGCGHGHIGNNFHQLGANVTSSDARVEHLNKVNKIYPHLKTIVIDADKDLNINKYDIIVHWGLLYHLKNIEEHIKQISTKCNVLLIETEVSDSDDTDFYIETQENGYDQAFNKIGIRPSPTYVEKLLINNGFNIKIINDPILNADFHKYDWKITNTQEYRHGMRRFWICWKNINLQLNI
jgi:hypothetical protein